jgi:S1-C subfamily serine protease
MIEALILDIALVIMLIGYIVYGFRNGLSRSAFTIAGVIAGVIAAFFLAPLVATWVPYPFFRLGATVLAAVGLVILGHALGAAIGRSIRRGLERTPLSGIDRVLGGIVTGIAAALIASVVSFSVGQLGVPTLSRAIVGSTVLRTISILTPDPIEGFLAEVRGALVERGLPVVTGVLGGANPTIPHLDTGTDALDAAASSVLRITGNAYVCGQSQSGTGFVVSAGRVVTNAHVVAGVSEPVIETQDGRALAGTIVYFDPVDDLAVIAVPELGITPLPIEATLDEGTDAAFQGYPYGGPFASGAATVLAVSQAQIADIYGDSTAEREVYTLAADVREGNSGGPLLSLSGAVVGVVFARSGDTANIGYAMTMAEVDPVATAAAGLSEPVPSGDCIRE